MRALDVAIEARTAPDEESAPMGRGRAVMALEGVAAEEPPEPVEVECDVWYDLDGNPCAWSPVGSGVISIEIGEPDKDAPVEIYQALRDAERKAKSAEERIAELEAMVARLAANLAN